MKITLTADPEILVPPTHYGGIELIVAMLAHGFLERGHAVTLFVHQDSTSSGAFVHWQGRLSLSASDTMRNETTLERAVMREPFGIVIVMACGTPVLGFRRSAAPEVVKDGENGFVVDTLDDLLQAITRLPALDLRASRARVEALSSVQAIVDTDKALYDERSQKRPAQHA
jgi:hypothetical protein